MKKLIYVASIAIAVTVGYTAYTAQPVSEISETAKMNVEALAWEETEKLPIACVDGDRTDMDHGSFQALCSPCGRFAYVTNTSSSSCYAN